MPIYEYYCESCEHSFEELLSVSERDEPTKESCPICEENTVKKGVSLTLMGADANVTPDKMCPGFSRRMEEISNSCVVDRKSKKNMMISTEMKPSGHLRPN